MSDSSSVPDPLSQTSGADASGTSDSPRRGMRLSILLFALVIGGGSLWYLAGGGRAIVDRQLARLVSRHSRVSADDAIEFVRTTNGGPASMTVDDRLDIVGQRLGQAGIQLSDTQWDAVEGEKGGWVVVCTLMGNGYQRRLEWDVDADLIAAAPRNSAARKLDTIDASVGSGGELASTRASTPSKGPQGQKPEPSADADDIVLLGVMSSPAGRLAFIRTPQGHLQLRVGQRVKGWTLTDIRQRSNGDSTVVLTRGKETCQLRMSGRAAATVPGAPKTSHGSGAPAPPPPGGPAPSSGAPAPPPSGTPPPGPGPSGEGAPASPPPGPDPPIGTPNAGNPPPQNGASNPGGARKIPPAARRTRGEAPPLRRTRD